MCSIKFYIDKRSKKDLKPILMRVNHNGSCFKRGTGIKMELSEWNDLNGFPIDKTSQSFIELAKLEDKIKNKTYPYLKDLLNRTPTINEIKDAYLEATVNLNINEGRITDMIQAFIDSKKGVYSDSAIRHYERLKELVLGKFGQSIQDNINNLDKKWVMGFVDYLINSDYQNSSIELFLKKLRSVLSFHDLDISFKMKEAMRGLKKGREINPPKPYLTLEQVEDIVTNTVGDYGIYSDEGVVIALFEFASMTGLRFSDMMKLTERNIIEENDMTILRYTASKNGRCIMIPLSDRCKSIITIYSHLTDKLLPQLSNSKCNTVLTKILKEYGLNEEREILRFSGKNSTVKKKSLADILSWHSSRRGFGSSLLSKGMSYQEVSELMGVSVNTLINWYSSSQKTERNNKLLEILNR